MTFWSRRSGLAVAAGIIVWLASIALAGGAGARQRPDVGSEAFKNVQVLKGIPVDEFMGTMGLFSAALSVVLRATAIPAPAPPIRSGRTTRPGNARRGG